VETSSLLPTVAVTEAVPKSTTEGVRAEEGTPVLSVQQLQSETSSSLPTVAVTREA